MACVKKRTFTPFNAKANLPGTYGWMANDKGALEELIRGFKPEVLDIVDMDGIYPYRTKDGNRFQFFYMAPYELSQARWVKDNNVQIGDEYEVVRKWYINDNGFKYSFVNWSLNRKLKIHSITERYIYLGNFKVPYFALDKVQYDYAKDQAEWVEYKNIEVGDKVRIMSDWRRGEKGFNFDCLGFDPKDEDKKGKIVEVKGIESNYIKTEMWGETWFLPYFVLDKVNKITREFRNAEEFRPFRDKWWDRINYTSKRGFLRSKVTDYDNEGVYFGIDFCSYTKFYNNYRYEKSDRPAGLYVEK